MYRFWNRNPRRNVPTSRLSAQPLPLQAILTATIQCPYDSICMEWVQNRPDRQARGGNVELQAPEDISVPHSCHLSWCTPSATQRSIYTSLHNQMLNNSQQTITRSSNHTWEIHPTDWLHACSHCFLDIFCSLAFLFYFYSFTNFNSDIMW